MAKPSEIKDWEAKRAGIVGLGERSFHKSYYPQLRQNVERLERFHTVLDQTTDFVILVALPDGTVTDANAALGRLLGEPAANLIGRPFAELGLGDAQDVLDVLRREMSECLAGNSMPGHSAVVEFSPPGCADESLWLDFSYRVAVVDGRPFGVMVGRDITEQRRNHQMVTALLAEKEALLENALVGIIMVRQSQIVSCNRRFAAIFGYSSAALPGQSTRVLFGTEDAFAAFGEEAYRSLSSGESYTATLMVAHADGSSFWCELTGSAVDPRYPRESSIWIFTDVTERKLAEERASYLSYHDALTGLPNQLLMQDRLQQAIAFSNRMGTKVAPHAGLGVKAYAWSTSPLRRYVDLVNQWQIIACARHGTTAALAAPFKPKDANLFAIISGFDAAYTAYNGFQNGMERFWTLKHLQQVGITELTATLIKDNLVRADTLPLVLPVLGAEGLPRGAHVRVRLGAIDEIALDVSGTVVERLDGPVEALDESAEAEDEELAAPLALAIDVNEAEAGAADPAAS